ncbi:hypothetical protein [Legionella sp. km772]|uniref:hypothetical protein n=1 Tax=Legionella sp. km772 TaxID=2498111 RepID=UPI000F8E89E5|nr:hypothetical protein [Legionella sp. km772]RUR06979.1 hypothetical protein ELY15_12645 [Legionella sp. km772]
MEHKDIVLDKLLLTEPIRIKAQLKYELRNLEAHLARLIKAKNQQPNYFVEVANLCQLLIDKYLSYLSLMGAAISPSFFQTLEHDKPKAWFEHYQLLLKLKQQLHGANSEEEKNLTIDILTLYFYIKQAHLESMQPEAPYSVNDGIYKLFLTGDLKIWLVGLIHYWNQNTPMSIDFQAWPKQQLLYAIDFFASPECVHLINALFFYTLFPEQLEKNLHPEKRISLQLKIEHLHSYLTLLRQQLYKVAALNGIKPEVDFLCHSKDLPPGITFEVHSSYQTLILEAVKLFKLSVTSLENKLDKVHLIQAIFTAYKFRFDPCRFIDTAMVLRQVIDARDEQVFSQEMVNLYRQLTTSECLDLYGYFSNKLMLRT